MNADDLDKLIAHELFHVISRSQPELRKKLYSIIGFKIIGNIDYPDVLKPYRITNPDATQTDSYINVMIGDKEQSCMMILYASGAYNGGSFFNYLNIGFLLLQGDKQMSPVIIAEGPVIYNMKEVSNFYEQVGRNTQYIIHPEEIMADNFAFVLLDKKDLPDMRIVSEIKSLLMQ